MAVGLNRAFGISIFMLFAALCVFGLWALLNYMQSPVLAVSGKPDQSSAEVLRLQSAADTDRAKVSEQEALARALQASLRSRYADRISAPSVQTQVLRKVEQFVQRYAGAEPESSMAELLLQTFPEQQEAMLGLWAQWQVYDAWLEDQAQALTAMQAKVRQAQVQAKRAEVFGEQHEAVWLDVLREERLQRALLELDRASGQSLEHKRSVYMALLKRTYEADYEGLVAQHSRRWASRFLALNSVQRAMAQLPEEGRSEQVALLNRQLRGG